MKSTLANSCFLLILAMILLLSGCDDGKPSSGKAVNDAVNITIKSPHGDPTKSATNWTLKTSDEANSSNERTFSTAATNPTLTVECEAEQTVNADKLRWTIDDIGSIKATWSPHVDGDTHTGKGLSSTATFTGIPANNSDFGVKTITLKMEGIDKTDSTKIEAFFPRDATNHPGGQSGSPNWYYYWSQTSADYGTHTWITGGGTGYTNFVSGKWQCYIQKAAGHTAGGTWNNAGGIDLFANLCRHEEQHRLDSIADWGVNNPRNPALDLDGDYLPDTMEPSLVPSHPYNPSKRATYMDSFNYLPGAGFINDAEDYALRREASWTNGSANSEDWADRGMQHNTNGDADD